MRVTFQKGFYISESQIPGFEFSQKRGLWYTKDYRVASRLREYFDEKAERHVTRLFIEHRAFSGSIPYPPELTPYPFQLEAVKFALERNRSYLALDPGLGKTPTAAMIRNATRLPVFYICPPFLCENVGQEFTKWTAGMKSKAPWFIYPDSRLIYENIPRTWEVFLYEYPNSILFVDEAQRFSNMEAKRTKVLFNDIFPRFEKVVFLSGTPMRNRPMDLFPILSHAAPETIDFLDHHRFGLKYCNAFETRWGWDYSGAKNVLELSQKIKGKFMLRVKKEDVLKELPEKLENLIFIEENRNTKVLEMDYALLSKYSPEDLMKYQIGEEHISSYRKELGIFKIKPTADYVRGLLDGSDESILLFAIHKDVVRGLSIDLKKFDPLVIDGSVDTSIRQNIANEFQALGKKRRLLIGNIQACGVGFNLTKATRVVFAEFSWTPSDNEQASDRAHRIGQKNAVTCDFLVYTNSIDRLILETILRKKKSIEKV